ncbi:hypothetical protein ANO14919_076460 [Xylariales sp. No.14919]|nr:hypothetical protein ANO14919_076460 [Xylariales sp. No.14919]
MPFPTRHERDIPQQEGLTGSRLRERQRESRELERVSSFFLPAYPDAASRKPRPTKYKRNKETRSKQLIPGDNGLNSFTTSSSPTVLTQDYHHFLTSPENSCSIPAVTPSGPEHRPASSKTTYLTWSSSQYSPKARRCLVGTGLEPIEPARSVTPEDVRAALAFTGVYKNTGIHPYVSDDQQDRSLGALGESPTRNSITGQGSTYKGRISATHHKSKVKPKCANDTRATVAQLAHLEERWNTILPPEWRLQRPSKLEAFPIDRQQVILDVPTSAGQPSRQTIAQQAQVESTREISPARHACDHGNSVSNTTGHHITKSPALVPLERERTVEDVASTDQKRATIASRDAMPPPPIPPPRFNSLYTTQPRAGHELSTFIETARLSRNNAQLPSCEQPEMMDSYKATGQRCELGGVSEKVISNLDSVSWIPQAATSNVISNDRGQTLSRLSIKSPIYDFHSKERNIQGPSHLIPPPTSHLNENMTDFIARIESELDESAFLDEYHQPESSREDWGFSPDSTNTYDMQNRRLTASDGIRVDRPRLPVGVMDDLEFGGVFETNKNPYEYEELAASVRDNPTAMPTDGQGGDFDEFLEMSNFWRPNRFARF